MKKIFTLLLCAAMLLAFFCGCGTSEKAPADAQTPTASAAPEEASAPSDSTAAEPEAETAAPETLSALSPDYPRLANNDVSFSMWYAWPPFFEGTSFAAPEDLPIWKNVTERTGIKFEFNVIGFATASEQFNLMVASETLPDIITEPFRYSGSTDAALDDEVFYDVTGLLAENAPDYYALINREENYRDVYTDTGRVGGFWEIAEETFPPNSGLFIRRDMLDAVGLKAPETFDELHDVLTAIKKTYNAESPYFIGGGVFSQNLTGGYGFSDGFVNRDGQAVYSVLSENFAPYMEMVKKWYDEGLIYSDFYSLADNQTETDALRLRLVNTDHVGVWYNWCEDITHYSPENPDYSYMALKDPVLNKGEVSHLSGGIDPRISNTSGWTFAGTVSDEDAALLCQLANYFYTDEGALLANWGAEGESFSYNDEGKPMYTDLVLHNGELPANAAIGAYSFFRGAYKVDLSKFNQNAVTVYAEYCDVWAAQDNDWQMPNLSLTAQEQERFSAISTDVDTMLDENLVRFIIGERPMSELDAFIGELRAIGLEEMITIEQTAFDRYLAK